jgi:50S ribosomal subunit-associated GTPase HflX
LYRHITHDHKLPLVLLLNKCDLLPAAAAAAWQQWLQQQLPGVTVIPVSAAKEQAAATARAVLAAVLQQNVLQDGRRVPVQELVGLSLGECSKVLWDDAVVLYALGVPSSVGLCGGCQGVSSAGVAGCSWLSTVQ